MDRFDELAIFVAIIDAGSLAGAARRLRRSRPAVTRALAGLEERVGARLIEVPVWAWHWATPGDARMPWRRACRVALDAEASRRKRRAVQAFESQLQLDHSTGAGPILRASTVERAARPYEVLFA